MQASVRYRQQEGSLGMGMKEKDDDLGLFLELQKSEKEQSGLLLQDLDNFDAQSGSEQDMSLMSKMRSTLPVEKTGPEDFLNSENDRRDYDWLLTPPGASLFPLLEMETQKTVTSNGTSNGHAAAPATLADPTAEPAPSNTETIRQPIVSTSSNSSIAASRRSLSSGRLTATASRSATPNGQAALPTTAKASRSATPTSRATLPSAAKKSSRPLTPTSRAILPSAAKPTRPSTPTPHGKLPTIKPIAPPVRSSTPTGSKVRSSTPTIRPSAAPSKSTSRSSTPTRRSSTPSRVTNASGPAGRSSSVMKSGPTTLNNSVPSHGTSPAVKSRPQKAAAMPRIPSDAPNLKPSKPERPASASKARPGAPGAQFASMKSWSNGPRQQSSSPSRGRTPNGNAHNNGSLGLSRANFIGSDDVNPVLIGTKMVERVVNMRKLAPPKHDHYISKNNNSGKSLSTQENSGFGRSLSKKSLDMALRHMDIRRSIPGNLHPIGINIPASSVYGVKSGFTKSKTISVADSPLATSSNSSSEPSINYGSKCLDGSEIEDNELGNERIHFSLFAQHDG